MLQETTPDYGSLYRLDGRHFVVLGAGRGIGHQTVHALAQAGASVTCVDNDEGRARAVAAEVGGRAWCGDITVRSEVESLFEAAAGDRGTVHGVVGVPAWNAVGPLEDASDEDFDASIDGNLRYAWLALQAGSRYMREGGTFVFVASLAGVFSSGRRALYGATKAGMISLTRSAAEEFGPRGIRVNAVAPGSIITPRIAGAREVLEDFGQTVVPARRAGQPCDIASVILCLSSDVTSFVTGQTIIVDGGLSLLRTSPRGF